MSVSVARKLCALKAKTTSRGCTEAEASAAAEKAVELERVFLTTPYTDAVEHLRAKGWTDEQAKGIAQCLSLDSEPLNVCGWDRDRWGRFHDWCSAKMRETTSLESQLNHLHYELCNNYQRLGTEIGATTTIEQARKAFAPYVDAKGIAEQTEERQNERL